MEGMAMRKMLASCFGLCTGCHSCELICSLTKEGAFNPRYARLRLVTLEGGLFQDVVVCAQCENAACLRACPVDGALYRDPVTHAVVVDEARCTGCGLCAQYCPRHMISLDAARGKAAKCDLCGGEPLCARYCPSGALALVEIPRDAGEGRSTMVS
jgi:Fe-S-cluster-containing hydrogenase component 2